MVPSRCCLLLVLLAVAAGPSDAKCARDRQDVRIDNCSGKVCNLRKGRNTGITIKFRPEKSYRSLKAKVTGRVLAIEIPFNGVPSNACGSLVQGNCPLQQGQEYIYRTDIPVSSSYPSIPNIPVKFFLVDAETDEPVACALVRVNIR